MDTHVSSSNHSPLFSKNIYLRIISNIQTEEKCRSIHVTVEFQTGSSLQTELVIKLTDDDDPFFLYELHINAEDFKNLKQEEKIVVDFNAFPEHVIGYLKLCIRDQHIDITPGNGSRYQLQLVSGEPQLTNGQVYLRVVEISSFKHLTHLSLMFTSANDYEIRSYLARCLQLKKTDYNQLYNEYDKLKRELDSTQLE